MSDLGVDDVHTPGAGGHYTPVATPKRDQLSRALARDAAAVLLPNALGAYLAVTRNGMLSDLGFPAGMIEDGEKPEGAAARELEEETGVRVDTSKLRHVGTWPTSGGEAERIHVYRADARDAEIPDSLRSEPGEAAVWAQPSELMSAPTFGGFAREHEDDLFPKGRRAMAEITTKKRNALPDDAFADPATRAYPIHDAAHVRNAAARLEQQKASMSPEKYRAIRGRIARAARRFGISSQYNKRSNGRLHVRADIAHGGSLHVSHHMMRDRVGVAISLGEELPEPPEGVTLRNPDAKLVWIQLAEVGAFRGHSAGPFKLDAQVFSEIVRNFDRDGLLVPIDYEHASEQDPTSGNIPVVGAPATGWIHRIENRGDRGLWGLVEWSSRAREQIQEGAYRYLSPAVRFGAKDRHTGEPIGAKLTSAALTNQPFLKGMQPVAAKDAGDAATMRFAYAASDFLPKLKIAMRLPELATAAECSESLARLRCLFDAADGDAAAMQDGVRLADFLHPLRDLVAGGRLSATWEEVFEVVEAMIAEAMGRHIIVEHGGDDDEVEDAEMKALAATAALTEGGEPAERDMNMTDPKKDGGVAADAELAKATLKLSETESKLTAQEAELKLLREEKAKRDAADLDAEADAIIAGNAHLTAANKPALLTLLKADPVATRAMYPRKEPERAALMRAVIPPPSSVQAQEVDTSKDAPQAVIFELPDGTEIDSRVLSETQSETTSRLMSEGLSYNTASAKAWEQHTAKRRMPRAG